MNEMTEFECWYAVQYGVNPKDVIKNTPAYAQLQVARDAWDAGVAATQSTMNWGK